jgi:hypothetical protein
MVEPKLHTREEISTYQPSPQYAESVYRLRVPGGWMYIYSVAEHRWFGKKAWMTSTFVPDPK